MIDANQNEQDAINRRDSITIVIEGEEDHTVIDNPPGFPSKEELKLIGVRGRAWNVEIEGTEEAESES